VSDRTEQRGCGLAQDVQHNTRNAALMFVCMGAAGMCVLLVVEVPIDDQQKRVTWAAIGFLCAGAPPTSRAF
jgi:hypothetical protein